MRNFVWALLITGNRVMDSVFGTGTLKLLNDVSEYAIYVCPIVGGIAATTYLLLKSAADEQEAPMYKKKVKNAIICGVGGCLVSVIIKLLTSYYM